MQMEILHEKISTFFAELVSVLSGFDSISDILDVFLVAIIIYLLFKQLKKTQSVHIIKGIAFFTVIYAVVALLQMQTSRVIFDYVLRDFLLIMVIIFGTEIRQSLEQIGQMRIRQIFPSLRNQNEDKVLLDSINDTARACKIMSEAKIGSLIVFPRRSNLGDLERTGVYIDAKVSPEMLCSIFYPKAALHDGAIVIQNGRVTAARCIVSLKNDIVVQDNVGTRHRAALEVSRSSDAVVVVTSEETGIISIAIDGMLIRGITDSELRQQLSKYMLSQAPIPNKMIGKFKRIFKKGGRRNGDESNGKKPEADDPKSQEE